MTNPFFFGYGSLVNRATHDFANAHPARVKGWRRAWRHSPIRPVSFLTVVRDEASEILGLIAEVPGGNWAALDEREHAYARNPVSPEVTHSAGGAPDIALYAIPDGQHQRPGPDNPVLLSYVETVVQGFLTEYGEAGVAHFFDTTDGWDHTPILDDRAAPIYSRHRSTKAASTLADDNLSRLGARLIRR